jgi:hypothetical protein
MKTYVVLFPATLNRRESSLGVAWFQAVRIAKEILRKRERVSMLCYSYIISLVTRNPGVSLEVDRSQEEWCVISLHLGKCLNFLNHLSFLWSDERHHPMCL